MHKIEASIIAVDIHAALITLAGILENVLTALSDASRVASENDTYVEMMAQEERFAANNQ